MKTYKDIVNQINEASNPSPALMKVLNKHSSDWKKLKTGKHDLDDFPKLYDSLYSYYTNNGEMPYGTAKARDGDPNQWIYDQLEKYMD